MRFGSLFAGIGGFDLGFERAGMECVWQIEIDEHCLKVLEKHWPGVSRYTDIRECGRDNLEPVDLICGGFPCQPYSVAGKRRGAEDDRNLWPEFLRIVRELRPDWVVGENVPGIVPMYLDQVLSDLEGEAYTCWTFNIPACALDAPHRRERIWIVAYRERMGRETGAILTTLQPQEPEGHTGLERAVRRTPEGNGFTLKNGVVSHSDSEHSQEHFGRNQLEEAIGEGTLGRRDSHTGRVWPSESGIRRVADGVPSRVDRLRALGNAVVPQVAEFIGRRIMETL